VIKTFRDKHTQAFYQGEFVRRFQGFQSVALRKLDMIDAAQRLDDLRMPPSNRLEALSADRQGQHSIRINGQGRICFVWSDGAAEDVEIVGYH
jgi:proteic killer suppression protein